MANHLKHITPKYYFSQLHDYDLAQIADIFLQHGIKPVEIAEEFKTLEAVEVMKEEVLIRFASKMLIERDL